MKFELLPLLHVRKHAEELARQELLARQVARTLAEQEARHRHSLWQNFAAQRPELERDLFETVREQELTQKELENFFADVAALRRKEAVLQEEAHTAAKTLEAAKEAELHAAEACSQAMRKRQKLEELHDLWKREEAARIEKQEESEREDLGIKHKVSNPMAAR